MPDTPPEQIQQHAEPQTTEVLQWIADWTSLSPDVLARLLGSLLIVLLIVLTRSFALRLARRHLEDVKRHYRWRRSINYISGLVALLLIGRIWLPGLEQVGVFLGLASAGLALALRDPLTCLAGWVFILVRRPFDIGDRVEVNGTIGDVIDIRMFQTYLLECGGWLQGEQATGRIVLVPNSQVFSFAVANYTQGFEFIWDEIVVRVTFDSDWRRAKELLKAIAESHCSSMSDTAREEIRKTAGRHMIFFQALTPTVYTTVQEWGVQLTVRFLCPPRQRRAFVERLWEDTLDAFAGDETISFAYPTRRVYGSDPTGVKTEEQAAAAGQPGAAEQAPAGRDGVGRAERTER